VTPEALERHGCSERTVEPMPLLTVLGIEIMVEEAPRTPST
jgi:hypothetical protein